MVNKSNINKEWELFMECDDTSDDELINDSVNMVNNNSQNISLEFNSDVPK